jgi:hypothetical protein
MVVKSQTSPPFSSISLQQFNNGTATSKATIPETSLHSMRSFGWLNTEMSLLKKQLLQDQAVS